MIETTALIIGYAELAVVALAILLFGFGLCWFAIHEARGVISSRKWRKRKLSQMKYETARDCAYYLNRWELPTDTTIYEACNYFEAKLREIEK